MLSVRASKITAHNNNECECTPNKNVRVVLQRHSQLASTQIQEKYSMQLQLFTGC